MSAPHPYDNLGTIFAMPVGKSSSPGVELCEFTPPMT